MYRQCLLLKGESVYKQDLLWKDHRHIRILQTMISAIHLILGLGIRISDPDVYVVSGAPILGTQGGKSHDSPSSLTQP